MNLTDIAQEVTSWLDDSQIKKLFVSGLLPTLSFSSSNSWWHARVETFSCLRVEYESETNWKQVYQIVKKHIGSCELGIWNEYDNLTASKTLERMKHRGAIHDDMIRCCQMGTVQIMSHLLTNKSIHPSSLTHNINPQGALPIWISAHALDVAVWNSQPEKRARSEGTERVVK